ncbi:45290_t:CDS:2, partial [Gigaspora margarita]
DSQLAKYEALLENGLAITICIPTRIPVSIISMPGSSRLLAICFVGQNLCGPNSNDELPQLYLIPHQGSFSFTSEEILGFSKSSKFSRNKEFSVISVVLLDKVGLAETIITTSNCIITIRNIAKNGEQSTKDSQFLTGFLVPIFCIFAVSYLC